MQKRQEVEILLVEDDRGHAELIEINLRRGGIANKIRHLSNGKQILDFLFSRDKFAGEKHRKHYIIMLDLNMPVMDGFQVLQSLKSNPRTKHIPVIILTTTENRREVERCYEMGCSFYISKPVQYEQFSRVIRDLGLLMTIVRAPAIVNANEYKRSVA